jgi:FtsH-binding integral membrane protein
MARQILAAPKGNFGKLLVQRKEFLASVYMLMAAQLAITAGTVHYMRQNQGLYEKVKKFWLLWLILTLVLVFVLVATNLPMPVKLVLFSTLSILLGMNMLAASKAVPVEAIRAAILSTIGVFVAMTIVGFGLAAAGINIGFMGFALTMALVALIIAWIVISFVGASTLVLKVMLTIGVVLFSIFVAYDTNALLLDSRRDVVDGALGLYLDVINLFSNLLGLDMVDG